MISLETLRETNALPMPLVNFQGQPLDVVAINILGRVRHFQKDGQRYSEDLTIGKFKAGFQLEETLRANGIETDFDRWIIDNFNERQRRIAAALTAWRDAVARGDPNDIVNIVTHFVQPLPRVSIGGKPLEVVFISRKWRLDRYEWNGGSYCLSMPERTTGIKLTWREFYAGFNEALLPSK